MIAQPANRFTTGLPPQSTVGRAIREHSEAVVADEANFDEDGIAGNMFAADASAAAEQGKFIAFVNEQCRSPAEVQAKVRYLLDGTVGERDTLISCLMDGGDALLVTFLRSLVTGVR